MVFTSCKKKDPVVPPVTPTPHGGEVQSMPYYQSFATEFGTYCIKSVLGDQEWVIDYQTAKMTGHTSSGNFENEDWLISSPVNIQGVEHAKAVVNYVAQYPAPNDGDITFMVSENYTFDNMPATAEWTQTSVTFPNTGGWQDFQDKEVDLDAYIGKTVTVAVKFTSTAEKSRTMEVKSITVMAGQAGGDTPTPPGPGTGSGTIDDPYDVTSGISLQGQNVTAWVSGYIVGAVKSGDSHNTVHSNEDIDWVAPFGRATNVLIADDPTCNEVANCIIVKMPSGSDLRSQVNLVDNPDNLGKQLKVNGTLKNAFGQSGLDSPGTSADFVLEGYVPPTPGETIYSETFANGQGDFTIQDVLLTGELTYVWAHDSQYACMKATAHMGGAGGPDYESESWLVSPSISLGSVTAATLKFSQAVNYLAPQGVLFVKISTNYNGDVTTADWTDLTLNQWPAGTGWAFVNSTADLTSYAGQSVTIAFKYTSTNSASATWEVKNFVVEEPAE